MNPRLFTFVGGEKGPWKVVRFKPIIGEPLPETRFVDIFNHGLTEMPEGASWILRGVTSNERYVHHDENQKLTNQQTGLGRPAATHAALIPIRKNGQWWSLTQDERRAIFEERSRHTATGLKYLPSIARRLHHCRDLELSEPFDLCVFVTRSPRCRVNASKFGRGRLHPFQLPAQRIDGVMFHPSTKLLRIED